MTIEEARIVANILGTADGGCLHCIRALVERFESAFPQFSLQVTEERQVERMEGGYEDDDEMVGYVVAVSPV